MARAAMLQMILCFSLALPASAGATVLSSWVQMAPGGLAEARAVVQAQNCPDITIDGRSTAMRERATADAPFPQMLCAATLLRSARAASIARQILPLPKRAPDRIVVLGDTGCRIAALFAQACNDPARWPFARIATVAAKLKPDLVLHVGDYLYRESRCPFGISACAGSPSGDDWPAWAADFFTPAAPLLAAAPFVFVRGNHEECSRSGAGWLRLLGPFPVEPKSPCADHVAPWSVAFDAFTLAVMDDSHAPELLAPGDRVALYRADFEAVARMGPAPVWLAMHRPIWGIVTLSLGMVVGGNRTMMAAQEPRGVPANVSLLLAGHIHTFEAIDYASGAPPQILAGEGGDLLDHAPRDLSGRRVGALRISSGLSLPGYGFLLFTRVPDGWEIHVMNVDGAQEALCRFAKHRLDCSTK
jgi:hypothetical protein